jgi:hypothetical protein
MPSQANSPSSSLRKYPRSTLLILAPSAPPGKPVAVSSSQIRMDFFDRDVGRGYDVFMPC